MCGILAIFTSSSIKSSEVKMLTDQMIHRGPDGEGYFFVGAVEEDIDLINLHKIRVKRSVNVALSHRRLSILDLSSAGSQPMEYQDRYVIVFNGEIYNHIELRDELKSKGYTFSTNTDTEVILAAFDCWKEECLQRFNGMWAFILMDKQKDEIFISRDRFGKKPLYYYQGKDYLIFSSEIKPLLRCNRIQAKPNISYLHEFLRVGGLEYLDTTAFHGINRFPKATYYRMQLSRGISPLRNFHTYWTLRVNYEDERFDESMAQEFSRQYYELLKDAVRIRLRSDVRVGVTLSGGVDSSSIVFLMKETLGKTEKELSGDMETFSSVFKAPDVSFCDESQFIDSLAAFLKVRSKQVEPEAANLISEHSKVIHAMENPPDGTSLSSWQTYKMLSQNRIKVNLDGTGADEVMAGYLSYLVSYFLNFRGDASKEKLFFTDTSKAFIDKGIQLKKISAIMPLCLIRTAYRMAKRRTYRLVYPLNRVLEMDINGKLANFLHYLDRMAMAHSVESRTPFLDYRVVEFLMSIPASYKIHNGWLKYLSRRSFDGRLPYDITWRRNKMGWPTPDDYWIRRTLKDWAYAKINKSLLIKDLESKSEVKRVSNMNVDSNKIIRLLNLATWEEIFLNKCSQ